MCGLAAVYLPARRAASVDLMQALRAKRSNQSALAFVSPIAPDATLRALGLTEQVNAG